MLPIHSSPEFLRSVVEPDYREAYRNPESVRHAFHFVVGLFSLRDWVFHEFGGQPAWRFGTKKRWQEHLERICPEFAIVTDLANSAKHWTLTNPPRTGEIFGARDVDVFGGCGVLGVGAISGGAISSAPTIEVRLGKDIRPVLGVAERVLFMWRELFAANGWASR